MDPKPEHVRPMERVLAVAMPAKMSGCSRSSAKLVLLVLARYVSWKTGGGAWPSQAQLAEITHLHRNRVAIILRELRASGHVVQHRPANPRRPAVYGLPAWLMNLTRADVTGALARRDVGPEGVETGALGRLHVGPAPTQQRLWGNVTSPEVVRELVQTEVPGRSSTNTVSEDAPSAPMPDHVRAVMEKLKRGSTTPLVGEPPARRGRSRPAPALDRVAAAAAPARKPRARRAVSR